MQMDVQGQAGAEARAARQQARGQVEGHAVDVDAQQLRQAHVDLRHQRQRRQEVLTELAVGGPGPLLDQPLEGQRVDQDRTRPAELDVVGAGILQAQATRQGALLDLERGQRSALELPEAPLVGIGDEGDAFRLKHLEGQSRIGRSLLQLTVRNKQAPADKLLVQPRGAEQGVVLAIGLIDLPQELAFPLEQESGAIAERSRQPPGVRHQACPPAELRADHSRPACA